MELNSTTGAEKVTVATGAIGSGGGLRLLRMLHGTPGNRPAVLMADSDGGDDVSEAINLAVIVQSHDVAVLVGPDAARSATRVLIPASAGTRGAYPSSRIGVRSVARGPVEDGLATMRLARETARAGVPPSVIGRMAATPPRSATWPTAAEPRSMGVHIHADPAEDLSPALPTAAPSLRTRRRPGPKNPAGLDPALADWIAHRPPQ